MTNSGRFFGPTVQITCRKVTKMADWRHCFGAKKANYQQESDEHDKCEVVDCQGTAALSGNDGQDSQGERRSRLARRPFRRLASLQINREAALGPFSVRRQALGCAWSAFTCRVKVRALASHRERAPPTDPRGQGWAPRRQASAPPRGPLGPWAPPRPLGPAVKRSG